MQQGENIKIKATVLRVDEENVHAQTADGRLIQTHVSNVEAKAVLNPLNHKSIQGAPENKSGRK